jgi:hypothetical protein
VIFRRTFSDEIIVQWQELVAIANTINLIDDEDQLIRSYETHGIYSSKSMYYLVNFRGVTPFFFTCCLRPQNPS